MAELKVVNAERWRLFCDIQKWSKRRLTELPQLMTFLVDHTLSNDDLDDIENHKLWLPSDFDMVKCIELNLQKAVSIELELRKGEAYDALREVRASISHVAALVDKKRVHVRGTKNTTRAVSVIHTATEHRDLVAEEYNLARRAIISLDESYETDFRVITPTNLTVKPINSATAFNSGKNTDAWVWTVGIRSDESTSAWEDEGTL